MSTKTEAAEAAAAADAERLLDGLHDDPFDEDDWPRPGPGHGGHFGSTPDEGDWDGWYTGPVSPQAGPGRPAPRQAQAAVSAPQPRVAEVVAPIRQVAVPPVVGSPDVRTRGAKVMARVRVPGVGWAYINLFFGLGMSVLANVMNTDERSTRMSGWDVLIAGSPPLGMFLLLELFAKFPWGSTKTSLAIRWVSCLAVAPAAALVSWRAISHLMLSHGADPFTAYLYPLLYDGLLAASACALLLARSRRQAAAAGPALPQ